MSMYDNQIKSKGAKLSDLKPHIFFHMGYWRVSTQPRTVSRNPTGTRAGWWSEAHKWVDAANYERFKRPAKEARAWVSKAKDSEQRG